MIPADRELVESNADEILPQKQDEDVAFLVVGDPFGATTHTDLVLRANEKNIQVQTKEKQKSNNIIHNTFLRVMLYLNNYLKTMIYYIVK